MSLSIQKLELSYFRSHRRASLGLDGRPVALFGANGAGKTNLIEAVSLLSPGRGMRRAQATELMRRPETLGWKISAQIAGPTGVQEIETRAEAGEPRQTRINGKLVPQTQLARIIRVLWLVPSMDRLWIEGAEGRRRFLDRIALSFRPDHADAALAYEKAMRERNRLLKDQVSDARWYDALEAQMAKAGEAITLNRTDAIARLAKAQADAETAFPVAELALLGPDGGDYPLTEPDLLAAFAESRAADLRAGRSLVGPHRADLSAVYAVKGVLAAQSSTGEQKALLISLILANCRALAEDLGAPPIILLDEVAAHLDANRRAALYDEICALGAQAFMTGTGAELFSELGERAQHFSVTEQNGESSVKAH
ncbi:DNA replication/repair protein RecF [Qingshengfaniella alkalisoli]|uniref:DNA replication and repair protein RecF n=1 Tax=Qingshengfaniella alkalisoli TaxID=2599296 RepID=A0A5B8IPE0_9RHOB|nr:DNA replication/repair protein RecF [Qingshengfaniella alkalisoli]QDY68172.1 DNA replication/repair protein RecF [Qingshengfaniella alkalisoli]